MLAGKGQEGIGGGESGNLYLRVKFAQHPDFRVRGADLYYDLDLAPWEAVLGTTVHIPTLDGTVSLKIPAGTVSERQFRLRGKGVADGRRNTGRFVCHRVHRSSVATYAGTKSPVGAVGREIGIQPEENFMSKRSVRDGPSSIALELFQPKPNVLYSLDAAAHLAGVPRRSILIYYRAGLVRPVFHPPYGVMEFTEEAIHTLRQIEYLRYRSQTSTWPCSRPCSICSMRWNACGPSCAFCVTIEEERP